LGPPRSNASSNSTHRSSHAGAGQGPSHGHGTRSTSQMQNHSQPGQSGATAAEAEPPARSSVQAPTHAQPRAPPGAVRLIGTTPQHAGKKSLGVYHKQEAGVYVKASDPSWVMRRDREADKFRWHVGEPHRQKAGGEVRSDASTSPLLLPPNESVGVWTTWYRNSQQWLQAPELVCISEEVYQQGGCVITGAMINIVFHACADVYDKDVQLKVCYDRAAPQQVEKGPRPKCTFGAARTRKLPCGGGDVFAHTGAGHDGTRRDEEGPAVSFRVGALARAP
jgi:hypothetical protein